MLRFESLSTDKVVANVKWKICPTQITHVIEWCFSYGFSVTYNVKENTIGNVPKKKISFCGSLHLLTRQLPETCIFFSLVQDQIKK